MSIQRRSPRVARPGVFDFGGGEYLLGLDVAGAQDQDQERVDADEAGAGPGGEHANEKRILLVAALHVGAARDDPGTAPMPGGDVLVDTLQAQLNGDVVAPDQVDHVHAVPVGAVDRDVHGRLVVGDHGALELGVVLRELMGLQEQALELGEKELGVGDAGEELVHGCLGARRGRVGQTLAVL